MSAKGQISELVSSNMLFVGEVKKTEARHKSPSFSLNHSRRSGFHSAPHRRTGPSINTLEPDAGDLHQARNRCSGGSAYETTWSYRYNRSLVAFRKHCCRLRAARTGRQARKAGRKGQT